MGLLLKEGIDINLIKSAFLAFFTIGFLVTLINIIDTEEFVSKLEESTGKVDSSLEDTVMTLERAKDYINSDILGILVLTE